MKNTLQCPKCLGREIVYAPGGKMEDQNKVYLSGGFFGKRVRIAHYICRNCGYAENWIDREDDMAAVRQAEIITQTPQS